jgi:hypothetical protein
MKEKDGYVDCPEQQMILYVEKEDGSYGPMQTGSFITANYIDDYFHKRKNLEKALLERISNGEISPVHYYMILEDLTLSELAARAGIWKWKVKRHLKPENFSSIRPELLERYATVFNVSTDELLNPGILKSGEKKA